MSETTIHVRFEKPMVWIEDTLGSAAITENDLQSQIHMIAVHGIAFLGCPRTDLTVPWCSYRILRLPANHDESMDGSRLPFSR
jgi:hypothetical protein